MQTFRGRMVSHEGGEPFVAVVTVDDEWVRIVSGHRRLGAWARETLNTQRVTVFRFQLDLDGSPYTFTPDDPATFPPPVLTGSGSTGPRVRASQPWQGPPRWA